MTDEEFAEVLKELIDDGWLEPKGVNKDGEVTYGLTKKGEEHDTE